jgi:RNA polymerase sigma-70 factor (ECF subfamily)
MSVPFNRLNILTGLARSGTATKANAARDRTNELVISLFDRFRNPLLHYLSGFGLRYPDGEEIVQEVFLLLFQHLERGKSEENLPAWIYKVAHNLALKKHYRARRESEVFAGGTSEYVATDPEPTPEQQLMDRQVRVRLLAVVRAQTDEDRRCLFLRAEGFRYREIARILGMSLGAVSISLSRSLARLARVAER